MNFCLQVPGFKTAEKRSSPKVQICFARMDVLYKDNFAKDALGKICGCFGGNARAEVGEAGFSAPNIQYLVRAKSMGLTKEVPLLFQLADT